MGIGIHCIHLFYLQRVIYSRAFHTKIIHTSFLILLQSFSTFLGGIKDIVLDCHMPFDKNY
jgi:hypothetical protein